MILCPKCHNEVPDESICCNYCGYKFYHSKSKKVVIISIIASLIVILSIVGIIVGYRIYKSNEEEEARNEYYDAVMDCTGLMYSGCADAANICDSLLAVWKNSIYEIDDPETDKYTHDENGEYYEDFNDALGELFEEEAFSKRMDRLRTNFDDVGDSLPELNDPPEGCEQMHSTVLDAYDAYFEMVNCAISPTGTYDSFHTKYNDSSENALRALDKMKRF